MVGYSCVEVARILGVTRIRVEYLRQKGVLGTLDRVGKTYVYKPSDVLKVADLLGVEVPGFKDAGK